MAIVSVGLVLAQRLFIKWAEQQLDHPLLVVIIGGLFVIYAVLVGVLLIRLQRKLKAARIFCPQCGAALEGMSEHMATATGRCDTCRKAVWVEADWEGNQERACRNNKRKEEHKAAAREILAAIKRSLSNLRLRTRSFA